MSETPEKDFDLLARRAADLGYYVQRHRQWDPNFGTGDLYIMERRRFPGERLPTILKYATADEIHNYLNGVDHGHKTA
jgi:hypothetical protein